MGWMGWRGANKQISCVELLHTTPAVTFELPHFLAISLAGIPADLHYYPSANTTASLHSIRLQTNCLTVQHPLIAGAVVTVGQEGGLGGPEVPRPL